MSSGRLRAVLFVLGTYLFVEALVLGGLLVLGKTRGIRFDPLPSALSEEQRSRLRRFVETGRAEAARQHPVLGWVSNAEVNAAGMRDDREHSRRPSPGVLRISAFGDSFTYGSDVALEDSWARQLEALDPSLEVLNYGVGAYGLDQAYLRYLELGTEYAPHVVFIGYMSENIARNVNVFRPFYSDAFRGAIFTSPRFLVEDDELVLLENPIATLDDHRRFLDHDVQVLREFGTHDHHYQTRYGSGPLDFLPSVRLVKLLGHRVRTTLVDPIFDVRGMYSTESEAYDVTVRILDAFYREVLEDGALPVVVVFPSVFDQRRSREGKECRYAPLLRELDSRGMRYIDLLPALIPHESEYGIRDLVVKWGHFSPLGSGILARHVHSSVREMGLTDPAAASAAVEAERSGIARPADP